MFLLLDSTTSGRKSHYNIFPRQPVHFASFLSFS